MGYSVLSVSTHEEEVRKITAIILMCGPVASIDVPSPLEMSVSAVWSLLVFLLFLSPVSVPHTQIDMNAFILKMSAFFVCLFVCLQVPCLSSYTDNCFKLKLTLCSKVYFHLINSSDVTNVVIINTVNRIRCYFYFNQLYFFCTLFPDSLNRTTITLVQSNTHT
jgi:hypothetical protein